MTIKSIKEHANCRWHCGCKRAPLVNRVKKRQNLKIVQVIIEGLRGKSQILNKILEEKNIDIAVVQETKLMESTETSKLNGFRPF